MTQHSDDDIKQIERISVEIYADLKKAYDDILSKRKDISTNINFNKLASILIYAPTVITANAISIMMAMALPEDRSRIAIELSSWSNQLLDKIINEKFLLIKENSEFLKEAVNASLDALHKEDLSVAE